MLFSLWKDILDVKKTCEYLVQGEERDSSDEEWASAFHRMDPISQLGWRNRRGFREGPGDQLLRDVFEVSDAVHSAAMSTMAGGGNDDDDERPVGVDATGMGSMPRPAHGRRSPETSVEVEQEGDPDSHSFQTCSYPFCK